MANLTTTTSAPRLSRGGLKALLVAGFAALAILVAIGVANVVSDDETSATLTPETPIAVPIAVNEGIPPRGGIAEAIQEQQAPIAVPAEVSEGVPPRGGRSEAIEEQRNRSTSTTCEGDAELAGIC